MGGNAGEIGASLGGNARAVAPNVPWGNRRRDRADSSGLSGGWCVPAVEDVAAAPDEALSAGPTLLKPADDIESAEGFQVYADPAGHRSVSAGLDAGIAGRP
jgi:hypothetical protein